MNPSNSTPGDEPKRDQNDIYGESSKAKPYAGSAERSASSQHPVKAKPKTLKEEIYDVQLAKAIVASKSLMRLITDESTLMGAAKNVAMNKTNKIIAAAINYARKSANASEITHTDIMREALAAKGITTSNPPSTKTTKKNTKKGRKGGRSGNKS